MPNALTTTGLTTATYAELLAQYTAAAQQIYGNSIVLTSNTPDGQWVNIFIQSVLDVEDLLTQVFNSFDPDLAIGTTLDQRVAINGIQRQGGTYTITNVTVVTSQSVNLYGLDQTAQPVFTVADNSGNQWQLITSQLGVTIGSNVFAFQAATPGAQVTTPNTITVPVTIVLGVTSVNNPTTYTTLGVNEETDAELRIRRQQSVSLSSQGYLAGLRAALLNISGVTSVQVYENTTGSTSTGTVPAGIPSGIPGHTIWVIVDGTPAPALAPAWSSSVSYTYGAIASSAGVNYYSIQANNLNNSVSNTSFWEVYNPVALAIYGKRNAGCGMKGSTSYTHIQVDGTPFILYWDTVTTQNLYVEFTTGSLNETSPPNIAAIRSGLVTSYVPGVNEEVDITSLGAAVQALDPNTFITSPGFALTHSGAFNNNTLSPSAPTQQFLLSTATIIILPIIVAGATNTTGIGYNINSSTGQVTNTTLTIAHGGNTFGFQALGGYGSYTYSVTSVIGSSINASTGVYTSGGSAGSDTVTVTDGNGNTATCIVTVT